MSFKPGDIVKYKTDNFYCEYHNDEHIVLNVFEYVGLHCEVVIHMNTFNFTKSAYWSHQYPHKYELVVSAED